MKWITEMGGNVTVTDSRLYLSLDISLHIVVLILLSLLLLLVIILSLNKWMRHRRHTEVATKVKTKTNRTTHRATTKTAKQARRKRQWVKTRNTQQANSWIDGLIKDTKVHSRQIDYWYEQSKQAEREDDKRRLRQATSVLERHRNKWWDNTKQLQEAGIDLQENNVY